MYSLSVARIARKALALVACTGLLALIAAPVFAGHGGGLHIDAASWSGTTLTANGGADKPKRGGGPVELFDAADNSSLGLANLPNNGNWTFSGTTCADNIYATQDNITTPPFPVANGCGGGGNNPPILDPIGNKTVNEGDPLAFVVSASDPDGPAPLTLTASPLPNGATFTDNGDGTGDFSWPNATPADSYQVTFTASDAFNPPGVDSETITITVLAVGGGGPTARGDTYATPVGTTLQFAASRVSGVLYNDFGGTAPLTAQLVSGPGNGSSLTLNADGSFSYTPDASLGDNDNDSFTYRAIDSLGEMSDVATVNINILSKQVDFKIFMNYELGMHCTGFEFAYCCVLPPYNSILAQVVKPNTKDPDTGGDFARLLEGDPSNGLDGLGRETVMRDFESNGTFNKYYLEYYHDAQPRREGQGKQTGTDTLISAVEGNSLFYHSTLYDSAALDGNGALVTGNYEGADNVVLGDGDFDDPTDNYANGWLNHFYIYADLEGGNPNNSSLEADKIRLGVTGHVEYPADVGAALQPMGPTGAASGFDNVLTFSGDTGTVVYTQMKVLENLPVMLTSPKIWEALGLPLTPFEDSINFFGAAPDGPGSVDEDSIRPYVAMKARLHEASCNSAGDCTKGGAVVDSEGQPVIGFGTAPIDIPNCERCHSVPAQDAQGNDNVNSPAFVRSDFSMPAGQFAGASLEAVTDEEYQFWNAYYNIIPGTDSDWYSRLKGAAINMLSLHDFDQGTGFTANWPSGSLGDPVAQNTRLGKESVICQKCHADNVIAVVKSGSKNGNTIKPISEAIHWRHREISEGGSIDFSDAAGRSGGCQGCHPAHRSDGVMDAYPITLGGDNEQAGSDNRLALGGCFVGRDVHSNPMKDIDGAETPSHLNAVGQYLADNVFHNQSGVAGVSGDDTRGLWCTNCHSQLGQELWRTEDCNDLINGDCLVNPRGAGSIQAVASAVGVSTEQAIAWLDPTAGDPLGDFTHTIWDADVSDANLATIEVGPGGPVVSLDGDDDPSVNILSFCTTDDCVSRINANKGDQSQWRYPANPFIDTANTAVAVPFSAATDGRDHWLSPGEPHCADCHAAPYVEQSGNINPFPPFNYPAKASLMRYSKGHQGITCQGCHESIHGLYPVTPTIDTTSYAQAAALNHDGSHGPLKCGTCHEVDGDGLPTSLQDLQYNGQDIMEITPVSARFDAAVSWMHTFTDEANPLDDLCMNCHNDFSNDISSTNKTWTEHSFKGRTARQMMNKAEIAQVGHVSGDPAFENPLTTVCTSCHGDRSNSLSRRGCTTKWKQHLVEGRAAESVWEHVSVSLIGDTCGW